MPAALVARPHAEVEHELVDTLLLGVRLGLGLGSGVGVGLG